MKQQTEFDMARESSLIKQLVSDTEEAYYDDE